MRTINDNGIGKVGRLSPGNNFGCLWKSSWQMNTIHITKFKSWIPRKRFNLYFNTVSMSKNIPNHFNIIEFWNNYAHELHSWFHYFIPFLIKNFNIIWYSRANQRAKFKITSMLVTDNGDEMCWWQLWDVGDGLAFLVTNIQYHLRTPWLAIFDSHIYGS